MMKNKTDITSKGRALLLATACMLLLAGCGRTTTTSTTQSSAYDTIPYSQDIFAMDTYMTVSAYGSNAVAGVEAGIAEIQRLDALFSTGNTESEISILNTEGAVSLSADTEYLLTHAQDISKKTGGAFNIAVYPLMEAWGFPTGIYKVPSQTEIESLLALADLSCLTIDSQKHMAYITKKGAKVDLGGVAKGYTSARIMEIFREQGVTHGLVNLGGNVQVLGTKPDGSDWKVAIENPEDTATYMGILSVSDKAVITSGAYERYFEQDGVRYHHILDPATGYPADSGVLSVTIISDDGTLADELSTSLFVMGIEQARSYWQVYGDDFDFIMETEDQTVYITEGVADSFTTELNTVRIERE